MDAQPILYGKDVNTGIVTQLTSIGNLLMLSNKLDDLSDVIITTPSKGQSLRYDATQGKWVNVTKDYIHVNVFGAAVTDLYRYSTEIKPVLVMSAICWKSGSIPNPNGGQGGYVNMVNIVYDQTEGWITLNPSKTYRIDATASMHTWTLNGIEINWESRIMNNNNSVLAFSYATQFRDYLNVTMCMSTIYNTPISGNGLKITLVNRATSAFDGNVPSSAYINYDYAFYNSVFTITVQEI